MSLYLLVLAAPEELVAIAICRARSRSSLVLLLMFSWMIFNLSKGERWEFGTEYLEFGEDILTMVDQKEVFCFNHIFLPFSQSRYTQSWHSSSTHCDSSMHGKHVEPRSPIRQQRALNSLRGVLILIFRHAWVGKVWSLYERASALYGRPLYCDCNIQAFELHLYVILAE